MNTRMVDGVLMLAGAGLVVSGVSVKWGCGWALIVAGGFAILRGITPFLVAFRQRGGE